MSQPAHSGVAINHAESHENKIHSDELAEKFGFTGALVPGVTVFGLTSIALTKEFGSAWLSGHTLQTKFLKPAYHNDNLDVYVETEGGVSEARCVNKDGVVLCTLKAQSGVEPPEFSRHNFNLDAQPIAADRKRKDREEICWLAIKENEPFPVRPWHPSAQENAEFADQVQNSHEAFTHQGDNLVHPHLLLSQANQALVDQYEMPAWIHVGSEIRLHKPLLQATDYRLFATPLRKWRHKGHEFITVYIAYEHAGKIHTEILHTAIYRIAGN